MKKCDITDCQSQIDDRLIVCPEHWQSIPRKLRKKFYANASRSRKALGAALASIGASLANTEYVPYDATKQAQP